MAVPEPCSLQIGDFPHRVPRLSPGCNFPQYPLWALCSPSLRSQNSSGLFHKDQHTWNDLQTYFLFIPLLYFHFETRVIWENGHLKSRHHCCTGTSRPTQENTMLMALHDLLSLPFMALPLHLWPGLHIMFLDFSWLCFAATRWLPFIQLLWVATEGFRQSPRATN